MSKSGSRNFDQGVRGYTANNPSVNANVASQQEQRPYKNNNREIIPKYVQDSAERAGFINGVRTRRWVKMHKTLNSIK